MNKVITVEEFRRKYEGANWEAISSRSMDSMIEDLLSLITQEKLKLIEEFEKIIGKDEYLPTPDDFIITNGLNHFAIAKSRNILREDLRKSLAEIKKGINE